MVKRIHCQLWKSALIDTKHLLVCSLVITEYLNFFYFCVLCRTVQDGVETVVVLENGVMVSKTVNGQPVAVQPVGYFQDMSKKKL